MLGRAKKVSITKEKHDDRRRRRPEVDIEGRVAQIKAQIEETTSDYDREKLQERLAKLAAASLSSRRRCDGSRSEGKEGPHRRRPQRDARCVQEGIVPGGGVALLRSSVKITVKGENDDQDAGVNIVRRALQSPARQIVENAGDEASIVVGKILEKNTDDVGYNAQTASMAT